MHFLTLVATEVPKESEDELENKKIKELIAEMQELLETPEVKDNHEDIMTRVVLKCRLSDFRGLQSTFARNVFGKVNKELEPYAEQTEDDRYLEFCEIWDDIQDTYETDTVKCLKLPNGQYLSLSADGISDKYAVTKEGVIKERNWGQLKTQKSTKRTKRMKYIAEYPVKKIYNDAKEFAAKEYSDQYDEKHDAYGYYYNPNAFYDWYRLGERWPELFLVKEDCEEYSIGNIDEISDKAPQGYKWTVAARKKDICWGVMFDLAVERAKKRYYTYLKYFKAGTCGDDHWCKVDAKGVKYLGEYAYKKGMTLKTFLAKRDLLHKKKYYYNFYGLFKNGEYESEDIYPSLEPDQKRVNAWNNRIDEFIDGLNDETVLVGVDCHI